MTGLELSRRFFEAHGRPMLQQQFAEWWPLLAVGKVGAGSDCFGYDDEWSTDHDFEPGFCLFYPEDKLDRRTVFLLERAYAALPREFEGVRRQTVNPVGGQRHGVFGIAEFYRAHTGFDSGPLALDDWMHLPDSALAEAVNGAVFLDNFGRFGAVRARLQTYPEDVRRKKLAGHLLMMGQSGQYNLPRCLRRGDRAAAGLATGEFVRHTLAAFFLLNRQYAPYYKWQFHALRKLEPTVAAQLESLLLCTAADPVQVVETLAAQTLQKAAGASLCPADTPDLEHAAYAVNNGVAAAHLRNEHILSGI